MSEPKAIPVRKRLIFALDVPEVEAAWGLVERLGDAVAFYKVGLELAMTGGAFELVDRLVARGSKVFLDLKLFDIPETVGRAVERLAGRGVTFTTVHGNQRMMEAAARAAHRAQSGVGGADLKVLAVTVLTSLDQGDLDDLGFQTDVRSLVLSRARRALEAGCDGVVTSGLEAEAIRNEVGDRLLVVMPGIRPVWNDREPASGSDDQKRTVDVAEAFRRGADYIVVGRPIRDAPDPRAAAEEIQAQIRAERPDLTPSP
ncbi:MAG TPA: orotidine-5'-phosphate decarboxylase [Thermoanaerobaculia bacterium]|nr:orotidine-5'-phosphate decarboxylase [Thermoanaerobaculia bacterium]